jgi:thiol-disulfide isomerase/thioredoxin
LRAPVDTIVAPLFPTRLPWVNVDGPRSSIQRGRPMLVEFWDFCRPNSMRTLPYVKEWHARYEQAGLRVIGVHCPGFDPSRGEQAVRDAVARLGIAYPVLIDSELEVWQDYGNEGWPARYLFDGHGRLFDYHHGEGGYTETELAIQELVGAEREPLAPLRAEDVPGARVLLQTADQLEAYSGPYEAGGVWAVVDGEGVVKINGGGARGGSDVTIVHPGAYPLVTHERHTKGVLQLEVGTGVNCLATCFTPGIA